MNINKANMRLWVAALRSKKYKQTKGNLKRVSVPLGGEVIGHCCLGVICELAIEAGVEISSIISAHNEEVDSAPVIFSGSTGYLPTLALRWLGIEGSYHGDIQISMDSQGAPITAVMANDTLGWDFERIADEAERFYKLLEPDDEPAPQD